MILLINNHNWQDDSTFLYIQYHCNLSWTFRLLQPLVRKHEIRGNWLLSGAISLACHVYSHRLRVWNQMFETKMFKKIMIIISWMHVSSTRLNYSHSFWRVNSRSIIHLQSQVMLNCWYFLSAWRSYCVKKNCDQLSNIASPFLVIYRPY